MPSGARKRRALKNKNNKKGESQDSNNPNHHSNNNNNYSTHSHGSVDDSKSVDERESDGGEFEGEEEEEEIVHQREVDTEKGEGLKDEVVQVEKEDKSLLNGSGSADFSAVHVGVEEKSLENGSGSADFSSVHAAEEIVAPAIEEDVPRNFDVVDKEVAVVEEDEKSLIAEYVEHKVENPSSLVIDEKEGIVDCAEEETVEVLKESVEAQIIEEKEDVVKEVVELAPAEFISAGVESLVMPVPADVVDLELKKNVESSFSQISDDKNKLSSAMEAEKSEQIETPVKVASIDDEDKSSDAPAVGNGAVEDVKPLETDNSGAAVAINTSRGVDNGKELEIQTKPLEEQTPISTNPLLVRRTSWMGCCGLFEVFSGAKR